VNRFLRLFSNIFGSFFRKESADPTVAEDEIVTRYVFDKGYFSRSRRTVKYQAFWPHNGETSVFRISQLSNAEVWSLGNEYVAKQRKRSLKARADIVTDAVMFAGLAVTGTHLRVVAETSTHPLHANIAGWPEDESAIQMVAVELANRAVLDFPP
jgi:hypothetical protein